MTPPSSPQEPSTDSLAKHTVLFANLVIQQTNLALMFLGKVPHPDSGQPTTDLDMAAICIDTLEMLAAKTTGNLDKHEQDLLRQNLTQLRMAFVEATAGQPPEPTPAAEPAPAAGTTSPAPEPAGGAAPAASEDPRKKFVKKY